MSVEVGSWWRAPVFLLQGSIRAIEWVLTAFGWVSMSGGQELSAFAIYEVEIALNNIDFVSR